MYIFPEKGARGGVTYISNRCSKPNDKYKLKIADLYNISINNFLDKEKYVIHYEKLEKFSMAKKIYWIEHTKKNRSKKKNGDKDGKAL